MEFQTDLQLVIKCYFQGNLCLLSGRDINRIFGPFNYETTIEDPESKTMKIDFISMNDALVCFHSLREIYNQNNVLQLNFTLTGLFRSQNSILRVFFSIKTQFFRKSNEFSFQSTDSQDYPSQYSYYSKNGSF